MGILRTDIVSHSQLPDGNQSVEFDGTGDYLQVPASTAWRLGSANLAHKSVTIEWWVYLNSLSSHAPFGLNALSGIIAFGNNGRYAVYAGGQTLINESNSVLDAVGLNEWHHYALVLHGGGAGARKNVEFYRDGKLSVSNTYAANVAVGDSTHVLTIGVDQENNSSYLNGFISNFRWSDEIVYTSEFTVPKFKLKALPSTMLLCCQSSTSVTEAAVSVSGSVTSNGDPAVSAFGPGLKDDITDTGVVFDGVTTFDSQAYFVPPSGKTTERNRGRGVFADGDSSKTIEFINIQSMGNSQDFGDSTTDFKQRASVSSSTRTVTGGGFSSPNFTNILDFITIASTSNATDFGDLTLARRNLTGAGNNTRGIFYGGGSPSATNTIDFITIATAGDASDFGDATVVDQGAGSFASSTRAVFGGGLNNTIEFVTIATTGDAVDFGDLISGTTEKPAGASSSTRGLFICGESQPAGTRLNTIQFVTIATTGNATDFGDNTFLLRSMGACTNSLRAVYGGGNDPSATLNTLSFVTIATTGNGQDFGDLIDGRSVHACGSSDSHGGLE